MAMDKTEQTESLDILWKEYKLHIDLFNSYLTTCLIINIFYYAFAGGLLSCFFNSDKARYIFSLSSLFILGLFYLGVFHQTTYKIKIYGDYISYIAKKLNIRFVHIKPATLIHTANVVTYMMYGNLFILLVLFVIEVFK